MCLALDSSQIMCHHGTCPSEESLRETGRGSTSVVQRVRLVAPHGFSSGVPALKAPVKGLRDLPVGAPQGMVVFMPRVTEYRITEAHTGRKSMCSVWLGQLAFLDLGRSVPRVSQFVP